MFISYTLSRRLVKTFLKDYLKIFIDGYVCLCERVHATCMPVPAGGRVGAKDGWELPDMGAGSRTQLLGESSGCP